MMIDQGADSVVQNDKLWDSIAKNCEWIGYAQISNSFILLMALNEKAGNKALTAVEISEIIAQKSKGRLYKVPSTLRDALEYRLKREGLVEDEKSIANEPSIMKKAPKVSRYSITPKGQKLLQGWIAFLSAFP